MGVVLIGFKDFQIPGYVLKALYVIGFIRDIVDALCPYIVLPSFLYHDTSHRDPTRHTLSKSASLADEFVPVVRISDLLTVPDDCCTVCLADFKSDDKVRKLPKCGHVFHHRCLDRWVVDCCKMTCPICRNRFLPKANYTEMDSDSDSVWFSGEVESIN
ncbi:PREDICTED: E3 ubiquitin-protein ligase RHA1B-like [Camelina sativa]|uniref:E3 ubiquitin-protein ligase RHA1B-like n=1 Tax=Camelina sativa TaxID=90675 RepID=A0ABM0VFW0_CAMSA|nr:PREDICTED: E3 ubiquitin-protein ligase RHA1B-like [Camelina sativa]